LNKPLNTYRNVYFLGIGGVGMSALADYFHSRGYQVAGYDRTASSITNTLQDKGITVHFDQALASAPEFLWNEPDQTLIVYTPAIPGDNLILECLSQNNYELQKRSTVIGSLSEQFFTIAVGGAHGKTSTSALIAHILKVAGIPFYGFIGGVSTNYETNFLAPAAHEQAQLMLTEADEYDRSFLKLAPDITILTSTDADHLDIYDTPEALYKAYQQFASQTKTDGRLVFPEGFSLPALKTGVKALSFGLDQGDWRASGIEVNNHQYQFKLFNSGENFRLETGVPGFHNILNTVAAAAGLHQLVSKATLQQAVKSFKGVYRRFEWVVSEGSQILIDDYAHHPRELSHTIQTVRELYPKSRITGIFQPHLYSRTRDFAHEFAQALSDLDRVILLPIYPAREEPIPGVSSELIYQQLDTTDKKLLDKTEVLDYVQKDDHEIIVTLGAGDISEIVRPLADTLKDKNVS
jgi:UDP-N-acetylmuramate--alanine ligase